MTDLLYKYGHCYFVNLFLLSVQIPFYPLKSRDELPPILRALQYIYVTPELNEEVFRILEERVQKGEKKTGRYGMDLCPIIFTMDMNMLFV